MELNSQEVNLRRFVRLWELTISRLHRTILGQMDRLNGLLIRSRELLKKTNGTNTDDGNIQQFLSIYRITPNPNAISGMSPAELMFARKIRSVFNRLLPERKKSYQNKTHQENMKYLRPGDKVFF